MEEKREEKKYNKKEIEMRLLHSRTSITKILRTHQKLTRIILSCVKCDSKL